MNLPFPPDLPLVLLNLLSGISVFATSYRAILIKLGLLAFGAIIVGVVDFQVISNNMFTGLTTMFFVAYIVVFAIVQLLTTVIARFIKRETVAAM